VFSEPQRQIAQAVLDGADLEEIEAEIIDAAPLDEDQRSALWLYAEALSERRSDATREDELAQRWG
jgi:hypothetical protein